MARSLVTALLLVMIVGKINAQDVPVSSIIPSSAPAFTVLGISPTEISRPNNWSALQAAFYQNLVSTDGTAPKNFAFEFNPYWLTNHPKFTYEDYLSQDGFSLRNLALSIASAKAPFGGDSVQSVGFGFRLPIITGRNRRVGIQTALTQYLDGVKAKTLDWQADFTGYVARFSGTKVSDFVADLKAKLASPPANPDFWSKHNAEITALWKDTLNIPLTKISDELYATHMISIADMISGYFDVHNKPFAAEATKEIAAALKETTALEVSGALGLAFPTDQFDYSKFSQAAVWMDYTKRLGKDSPWDATAALRFLKTFDADSVGASSNFDAIGRLNYAAGSQQKFMISVWAVLRRISNDLPKIVVDNITYTANTAAWDNKYGVDIAYKISSSVAVSYSLGKNYENDNVFKLKHGGGLISFLNLFYSLNTKLDKDHVLKPF